MDELKTLEALGLTLPSPAYLFAAIFFAVVGYAAYCHGKKAALPAIRWIGVALMLYPYAISETWLLYVIGVALCAGLCAQRRGPR